MSLTFVSYLRSGKCCIDGEDLPPNPLYRASHDSWPVQNGLSGGARGKVKISNGDSPEGIMVQLIAPNGVRTTVHTDENGRYEFPKMKSGKYTLRIASPREFKPFEQTSVQVDGPTELNNLILDKLSKSEALPATTGIESQLSGEELLWNLSGSVEEKATFHKLCGSGCHSYQQILKNHYDERSWRVIVERMLRRSSPIINQPEEKIDANTLAQDEIVIKWLARVRGPGATDNPLLLFPRPTGSSNRVVVTEFELPRVLLSAHDVYGDHKGRIWYTSHLSRNVGRLDPSTGVVAEFQIPLTPGAYPGTHHVVVDNKGIVLFSENWTHKLLKLDPVTQQFTEVPIESSVPMNSGGFGNFALAPDGYIWESLAGTEDADKIDPNTGRVVAHFPIKSKGSYDSLVSPDGNYWAGGSAGGVGNSAEILNIRTGEMLDLDTGTRFSAARRGGFDPSGNPWFGGSNGTLVELDVKSKRLREYWPPTPYSPYTDFYTAMPDKNGEVWAGELHGRGVLRFDPRTGRWIEYTLPEPYAHSRSIWIDNRTTPVTVWFVDFSLGRMTRIQPLD